jgi:hypothetical protein
MRPLKPLHPKQGETPILRRAASGWEGWRSRFVTLPIHTFPGFLHTQPTATGAVVHDGLWRSRAVTGASRTVGRARWRSCRGTRRQGVPRAGRSQHPPRPPPREALSHHRVPHRAPRVPRVRVTPALARARRIVPHGEDGSRRPLLHECGARRRRRPGPARTAHDAVDRRNAPQGAAGAAQGRRRRRNAPQCTAGRRRGGVAAMLAGGVARRPSATQSLCMHCGDGISR